MALQSDDQHQHIRAFSSTCLGGLTMNECGHYFIDSLVYALQEIILQSLVIWHLDGGQ
jgi:hypothetical protein